MPCSTMLRIAFLAGSTIDHLVPILRYWMAQEGFATEVYIAPFRTIETEILNSASDLYTFKPDYVVLMPEAADMLANVNANTDRGTVKDAAQQEASRWLQLTKTITDTCTAHPVMTLPAPPADGPMSLQDSLSPEGATYRLQQISQAIVELSPKDVTFWDLASTANAFGLQAWHQPALWFHSKHAFNFDAYGIVAHQFSRLIAGLRGQAKKVCVLDLDQTLWGGIIGDDGLAGIRVGSDCGAEGEAYAAFQHYLKQLRQQGVMLAVCSKNELATAREPFLKHKQMVLRLEDITVFEANWNNKADNIVSIARQLNVGLQSVVFVDDNPVECDYVKQALPEVTVIHLPEDPADYIAAVNRLRLFDKPHVTQEDRQRTGMIIAEQEREAAKRHSINTEGFLHSLELSAELGDVDAETQERSLQLLHKTNQFNVTTQVLTELEGVARWYRLRDRFGEYGIVSVVVAHVLEQKLIIDAWVMSCRAFQRTLEAFVLRDLIDQANSYGCTSIQVTYCPTTRNGLVVGALHQLGFKDGGDNLYRYQLTQDLPATAINKGAAHVTNATA